MAININHQTNSITGTSELVIQSSNGQSITLTADDGTINVSSALINNLADPATAQDAATKNYVDSQISALVNGADSLLDTLRELAEAMANDPNFAVTIANQLTALQNSLTQEIADRQQADTDIQNSLTQEIADRQQADIDTLAAANSYADNASTQTEDNAIAYAIVFGG